MIQLLSRPLIVALLSTLGMQAYFYSAGSLLDKKLEEQQKRQVAAITPAKITHTSLNKITPIKKEQLEQEQLGFDLEHREEDQYKTYHVQSGDTLSKIWGTFKAPVTGSLKANSILKEKGITLRAGQTLKLFLEEQPDASFDIAKLKLPMTEGKVAILTGSNEQGYDATIYEPKIQFTDKTVTGVIETSLSQLAAEQGVPAQTVDTLVDAFGSVIQFRTDIRKGDTIKVQYLERKLEDGTQLSPGPVTAAKLTLSGKELYAIKHTGADGVTRYFDHQGVALERFFLRYPLKFSRISSVFTKARFHPVLKKKRPHNGTDFAAPTGTPIRSVADGKISFAGWKGASGKMIKITHSDKYATAYLHLSKIAKGIRTGTRVKRGQLIGNVGTTGLSTGPHLHFSFYVNGKYVDPMKVDLPRQTVAKQNIIPRGKLGKMISKFEQS